MVPGWCAAATVMRGRHLRPTRVHLPGKGCVVSDSSQWQQLHPNLARLTVRYDDIYAEMVSGVITKAQARELMNQLAERDDQGVVWKIDPDTGEFMRVTAFGDLEHDAPPTSGVLTADAFTYSPTANQRDPMARLTLLTDDQFNEGYEVPVVAATTEKPSLLAMLFKFKWWIVAVMGVAVVVAGCVMLKPASVAPGMEPSAPAAPTEPASSPKPAKKVKKQASVALPAPASHQPNTTPPA